MDSLDSWFAWLAIGYLCSLETPRHPYVGAGALCPRRRVEPCGTRALGGGASALLQQFAARFLSCLSFCCKAHLRTRRGLRPRRAACTRTTRVSCIRRRISTA